MKKSNIYLFVFLFISFCTTIYFWGCKQNSSEPETQIEKSFLLKGKVKSVALFEEYGKLHNEFLSNVHNNFIPDKKIVNKSDKVNFLSKLHKDYLKKLKLSNETKKYIDEGLVTYKAYHDNEEMLKSFEKNILSDINKRKAQKLNKTAMLAQYEQDALDNLCVASYNACSGVISISEYQSVVNQISQSYDEYYNATAIEEDAGNLLGICVAITQSSIEWWEQNPDAILEDQLVDLAKSSNNNKVMALPAWVAYDALGALGSGIGRYMAERLHADQTGGNVSWGSVFGAAAAGAVGASTGIVGKAFRWLTSWF